MHIPFTHIFRRRAAALIIAPLLLSGCIRGLFEGENTILRPEIIKVTVPTENPRPPAREICPPGQEGAAKPAAEQKEPQKPCPPVEEKLLPKELPSKSPETIMPVPPPAPKPPDKPLSSVPSPPRLRTEAPPPDFAYGNAVLTEDVAWQGEVLIEGVVTVAPQATLTIGPGTTVRFASSGTSSGERGFLLVQGRIAAVGTPEKPVLFTSRFAEPIAGDWQGIALLGSEKKNLLENCRLEGAETGLDASFSTITLKNVSFSRCVTGARLQDTVLTAAACGASGCEAGMAFADSEAELRGPVFSGNRSGVVAERSSLYLTGGAFTGNSALGLKAANCRVKITAARFTGNGAGLLLASSQGSVAGCRLAENTDYGLALADARVRVYGNEIARNGRAGLKVEDGKGVAWGNSFVANGGYDLYNAGGDDFRAMGNWWEGEIGRRIYDRQADAARGRVLYLPVLEAKPALP